MLLSALVVLPIAGAAVDPGSLVIRTTDVPAGFELDRGESGVRSNAVEAARSADARKLFVRWRRLTGYQRTFDRGERQIEARADVLAAASGARQMLGWANLQAKLSGIKGMKGSPAGIGSEGWIYRGGFPQTIVFWRYWHVFAAIAGRNVDADTIIRLARTQQRRMATALGWRSYAQAVLVICASGPARYQVELPAPALTQ